MVVVQVVVWTEVGRMLATGGVASMVLTGLSSVGREGQCRLWTLALSAGQGGAEGGRVCLECQVVKSLDVGVWFWPGDR